MASCKSNPHTNRTAAIGRAIRERGRICPSCRRSAHDGRQCKRRDCRGYHATWLGDQGVRMVANLQAFDGQTCIITITPPGADRLPWDGDYCAWRGPHKCSGKGLGCRVDPKLARAFNETAMAAWSSLWASVRVTIAEAFGPGRSCLLAYVPELQERGVIHYHVVLGARTARDKVALRATARLLSGRAKRHGWGNVDDRPARKLRDGGAAAGYCAKYLVKESVSKGVSALVMDGSAPTRAIYVSPRLSATTRCTMRNLRTRRFLFMATGVHHDCTAVERAHQLYRLQDLMQALLAARLRSNVHPPPWEPPWGARPA